MCVRALRITVLKSAGNFTRGECDDLSADKIHRVKCFMFTRYGIVARQQFSSAGAAGCVRKFQGLPENRHQTEGSACPLSADTVEKVFSGWRTKFLGPLMRSARGDVRDHIVLHKNDHGPSYRA
jgi:hypothetical protein